MLNSTIKENTILVTQTEDLRRQVQYLLRRKQRLQHPELRDIEATEMIDGDD